MDLQAMRACLLYVLCFGCGGVTTTSTGDGGDAGAKEAGPFMCETAPMQPTDIASISEKSFGGGLVVVGPYIYYAVTVSEHPDPNPPSSIVRRVKRDGSSNEVFVANDFLGGGLASDGVDLFYPRGESTPDMGKYRITYPRMQRISLTQTGAVPQTLPEMGTRQLQPATNGTRGVFWFVDVSADDPNGANSIAHWDGTSVTHPLTNAGQFRSWVVDATNVYWVDYSSASVTSAIMSQPLLGGARTNLATLSGMAYIAGQDDANLYFDGIAIQKLAKSGGTPVDLVPHDPMNSVRFHAVVDGWLYYSYWASSLWRIRTSGGAPEMFVPADGNSFGYVTGDACGIYWTRGRKVQWRSK